MEPEGARSGVGVTGWDDADPGVRRSLPAVWRERWRRRPDAPVLVLPGEGVAVRADELDERSGSAATRLAGAGVRPGDRVVWVPEPTSASIAAAVGILRLGAVLVPVNPSATGPELGHVVGEMEPVAFVAPTTSALWRADGGRLPPGWSSALEPVGRSRSPIAATGDLADRVRPLDGGTAPRLDRSPPEAPALVVFTSGTTGRPKGAVLTHRNLAAGTAAVRRAWQWDEEDRLVLSLPLFHVHGLCIGLFGTLDAGASAVVLPRFDEQAVLGAPGAHGATLLFGVPTMYHRLVRHPEAAALGGLRLCVSGSAPLSAELWETCLRRTGCRLLERYGTTETLLTYSNPYEGERRPGTVGLPLPGVRGRLVGVGDDGVGELEVRGPMVNGGYWRRGRIDAQPGGGNGWFRTGDLAELDGAGYLVIRGRAKELIITGGFNVYPAEVEQALAEHGAVSEVAVAGTPSDEWGEVVTAWVVTNDPSVTEDDLLEHTAGRLAPHKRPRVVHLIDSLPRNAMGKVERRRLPARG